MKTVIITFAGRKKYLEILFKYIKKYENLINEYHIYVSTEVEEDIKYIEEFYNSNKNFVKLFYREYKDHDLWLQSYKNSVDENSIYIKLDDDIVYLEETLFTDFVDFRKKNEEYPFIYPMIINNFYCNWILQENLKINLPAKISYGEEWKKYLPIIENKLSENNDKISLVSFDTDKKSYHRILEKIPDRLIDLIPEDKLLCSIGWKDASFCEKIHNFFIQTYLQNNLKILETGLEESKGFLLSDYPLVSINCVSWTGKKLKELTEKYGDVWQDESWVSIYSPLLEKKPNYVFFGTKVVHFSYYKQEQSNLDVSILEKYKTICNKICDSK